MKSFPTNTKHLSNLGNCGRLRSIKGLPPLIEYLNPAGCTSLETVCTLTPVPKVNRFKFVFTNCVKLDEHSICNIIEYTVGSVFAVARGDLCQGLSVC